MKYASLTYQLSLLSKEISLNVAIGNVNPNDMDVMLSTFPLPAEVQVIFVMGNSAEQVKRSKINFRKVVCTNHDAYLQLRA